VQINNCHRRLSYSNDKLLLNNVLVNLRNLYLVSLLDSVSTIADKWANKTIERTIPHYSTIETDFTSTCCTQKLPQDLQKLGQEYFFPSINSMNTWTKRILSIEFTKEIKEKGKIPFLDCLVTCKNNTLRTTVYRKPTHPDRLLDQMSYHPTSHKVTTVWTWTEEHKLLAPHMTVWLMKPSTWTLFLSRRTIAQTFSKQQTKHCLQECPNFNIWDNRLCSKCFDGSRVKC